MRKRTQNRTGKADDVLRPADAGNLSVCVLGEGQALLLAEVAAEGSARSHLTWRPWVFPGFPLCLQSSLPCWSWWQERGSGPPPLHQPPFPTAINYSSV